MDTTSGAAAAAKARGGADPDQAPGPGHAMLPGRRTMTAWFAVFTLYAGGEIFTRHADGTWGAWACGGYAVATILLLVTRTWLAPLAAAVIGAFLAPLAWMILKVPDTSTAEVVVINRSADYLVRHGTPYLPANLITDWQHYNPYLPLMELFGLPREAGLPGLLGDPRIWTSLVTVAALTAAFAVISPHPVRLGPSAVLARFHRTGPREARGAVPPAGHCPECRRRLGVLTAISVASPLVAFPLTVGVTDPPIIALTCLTLALASAKPRPRFFRAALALAVACAMKSTAWAVVPVLAVMIWVRESPRVAARFTGAVIGAAVLLALAAAPNALATPDAIKQNLIDYPLGTSTYKTVAASPLPGHVISQLGHAGHLTVDVLLLLAVIGFAAWLLARPPRDARDATVRLIVLYTVLFTLAPSTRYGYYAYPLALVGWLALTRRTPAGVRLARWQPRPRALPAPAGTPCAAGGRSLPSPGMGQGDTPSGVLLERGNEIAAIGAAIQAVRAGTGSVLLIEGEAGIGKTRLLGHACEQASAAGMTVLTARAAEYEEGYAWGVVRQLFETELRAGQPAADAAALAAQVVTRAVGADDVDSFAVLHGLYWLTAGIAQRAPLLLAVDDLHWADPPSQRFAVYLARRLDGLPVLLAATVREPRAGTAQDKALTAGLAAEPDVRMVCPAPLSADGCARLTGAALSQLPSPAFTSACHELTGGNPLLLRGLLAALAAEGVSGTDADVAHLRRLTPETVSRHVLLRLGRMPEGVLAAARAIAVLGTSATTARVGRLARLDDGACADAVAALMAEQLVSGELSLRFNHPLVRSAIYQDLSVPLRQRRHKEAARLLAAEGATVGELTTHLLAASAEADPWVVAQLRTAAVDARGRGAPDVAAQCLERALAEPPPPGIRAEVLYELGAARTFHAPAAAAEQLSEARGLADGWPLRGKITVALSEALALCGRFAEAVALIQETSAELPGDCRTGEPDKGKPDRVSGVVASMQAILLNIARWDLSTRTVTRPLVEELLARADSGTVLDPQLHANLAIELTVAGTDRDRALWHARAAVRAASRLISLTSTALPEAVLVLSLADAGAEAWAGVHEWQEIARRRGRPVAAAIAASIAAHLAAREGDLRQSLAFGEEALAADDTWVAILATAFLVPALIDAGETEKARTMLAERGLLEGKLLPVFPFNVAQYARGCLHASCGDHEAALVDLLALGTDATRWGIVNPAAIPWRSASALAQSALGDRDAARRLAAEEIGLARRWGTPREIGMALRAAGLIEGGDEGIDLLSQAVSALRGSSARLELARALGDLGAARRRAGNRGSARDLLRESLDLAHSAGGHAVAARAREELVAAGGRPRREATHGRDALTPSELRVAELAAAGRTNRQIAQALFVTQRTVENHLTSTYVKLVITARSDLAGALAAAPHSGTLPRYNDLPSEAIAPPVGAA